VRLFKWFMVRVEKEKGAYDLTSHGCVYI
jgi:hypothetical protein